MVSHAVSFSLDHSLFLKHSYTVLDLQSLLQSLTNKLTYILDHIASQTFSAKEPFSVIGSQFYDCLLTIHTQDHVFIIACLIWPILPIFTLASFSHANTVGQSVSQTF